MTISIPRTELCRLLSQNLEDWISLCQNRVMCVKIWPRTIQKLPSGSSALLLSILDFVGESTSYFSESPPLCRKNDLSWPIHLAWTDFTEVSQDAEQNGKKLEKRFASHRRQHRGVGGNIILRTSSFPESQSRRVLPLTVHRVRRCSVEWHLGNQTQQSLSTHSCDGLTSVQSGYTPSPFESQLIRSGGVLNMEIRSPTSQ